MEEKLVRPKVTESEVCSMITRLYPVRLLKIKQLEGYDDLNFHVKCESQDDGLTYDYICKILNNIDSKKPERIEVQNRLMEHLGKNGINAPRPVPDNWLQYYSIETFGTAKHLIRLLTYVDGDKLNNSQPNAELYQGVGDLVGRIYCVLKGYEEKSIKERKNMWMLSSVPDLHKYLNSVEQPQRRELARAAIQDFEETVVPVISKLEKGVMHGDINEHNILVQEHSGFGLIDFGDVCWGPVIFEIALCLAYMCIHANDVSVGKHVLTGYHHHRTMTSIERQIIKICVRARLAQSLVLGCRAALEDPGNAYILSSQKNGWPLLSQLTELDDCSLKKLWGLDEV